MTVDIMQRKEQRIQTSNFSEGTIGTRSRPRPEESSRSFGKVNKPRSIPTTMAEPRFSLCSLPISPCRSASVLSRCLPVLSPTSLHGFNAILFSSSHSLLLLFERFPLSQSNQLLPTRATWNNEIVNARRTV